MKQTLSLRHSNAWFQWLLRIKIPSSLQLSGIQNRRPYHETWLPRRYASHSNAWSKSFLCRKFHPLVHNFLESTIIVLDHETWFTRRKVCKSFQCLIWTTPLHQIAISRNFLEFMMIFLIVREEKTQPCISSCPYTNHTCSCRGKV
jgi:hypothetical protein